MSFVFVCKVVSFAMARNAIACLESWADELLSRALRVRNLIGDAHWLSDGHHKEEIVREYLVRHLPQSLRVTRGFVCSTDADTRVSPEVDVLITDQEAELPWFAEGALIIAPPSAARGQIHVKTEFGTKEIIDILEAIFRTCESCEPHRDPSELWSGAIFFAHSDCPSDDPRPIHRVLWLTQSRLEIRGFSSRPAIRLLIAFTKGLWVLAWAISPHDSLIETPPFAQPRQLGLQQK